MKKILIFFTCLFFIKTLQAQKLKGLWYSNDSTRIYEIKQTAENNYIAVIKSSTRKKDSVGYVVIKDLAYNARKNRYEGVMYAVSDGKPAFVKIKFSKTDAKNINLKLSRMFVFDASINWIKADI